jgi:hypothetical protein
MTLIIIGPKLFSRTPTGKFFCDFIEEGTSEGVC